MSPRFSFNRENAKHVFHVFLWTVGSAFVTLLIAILADMEVPGQWLLLLPLVNTGLVALKEFMLEQAQK